ncbi:MAG: hypothetical protein OSJ52_13730 [Lachnospiraceae bacterium]|nr:hypothetical protein [Lachnospiraceae bacterium]
MRLFAAGNALPEGGSEGNRAELSQQRDPGAAPQRIYGCVFLQPEMLCQKGAAKGIERNY